jgi:hypothetical protein
MLIEPSTRTSEMLSLAKGFVNQRYDNTLEN